MKEFDSLCDTFNIDGVDDEKISKELLNKSESKPEVEDAKSPVIEYKGQKYTLESLKYMKVMLQEKISQDSNVLDTLGQMCKLNSQPRYFEVYATLSNTIAGHLKQLQDLEKIETDYQVAQSKEELQKAALEQKERITNAKLAAKASNGQTLIQNNTTNLYLSSDELDDMIEKADEETHAEVEKISSDFDLS